MPLYQTKKLTKKYAWLFKAVGLTTVYAGWILFFRLVVLSFITYFLISGRPTRPPLFEDISELYGANELSLMGLCAFLFIVFLRKLNPMPTAQENEFFSKAWIKNLFLPGLMQGLIVASGVSFAFLVSRLYRYLGFFIQFEGLALAFGSIVLRIGAILLFIYCEEFFFRRKILQILKNREAYFEPTYKIDISAILIVSLLYCGIKMLQFDLGIMHLITLFLISVALSLRSIGSTESNNDFTRGAGFWAAFLVLFHPVLSLPVFGNEFSGILLLKYQALSEPSIRFLTGGAGGPLSGFVLQVLILFDIVRSALKYKKILLKTRRPR